jgi:acetolactate synthase regulatory subunit
MRKPSRTLSSRFSLRAAHHRPSAGAEGQQEGFVVGRFGAVARCSRNRNQGTSMVSEKQHQQHAEDADHRIVAASCRASEELEADLEQLFDLGHLALAGAEDDDVVVGPRSPCRGGE